jgi:hypothetical protein
LQYTLPVSVPFPFLFVFLLCLLPFFFLYPQFNTSFTYFIGGMVDYFPFVQECFF